MAITTVKIQDLIEEAGIHSSDLLIIAKEDGSIPPKKIKMATLVGAVAKELPFAPKVIGALRIANSGNIVKTTGIINTVSYFALGSWRLALSEAISTEKHICIGNGNTTFVYTNLPSSGNADTIDVFTAGTNTVGYTDFQLIILQFAP